MYTIPLCVRSRVLSIQSNKIYDVVDIDVVSDPVSLCSECECCMRC